MKMKLEDWSLLIAGLAIGISLANIALMVAH